MLLFKKCMLLSAVVVLITFCTACTAQQPTVSTPVEVTPPSSTSEEEIPLSTSDILPAPDTAVLARGKELLKEYNVQYNQVIRFPIEGRVCETSGAYALTTIEEAHTTYPDLSIPEKLGDYKFLDLTIDHARTSNVFHDMVPRPKNEVEVLTIAEDRMQYFLCYKNDFIHFRLTLFPTETPDNRENFDSITSELVPWSLHSDVYVEQDLDDPSTLPYFIVSPTSDGKYGFFVQKMVSSDCLESDLADFTKEEALSIYEAIREGFTE